MRSFFPSQHSALQTVRVSQCKPSLWLYSSSSPSLLYLCGRGHCLYWCLCCIKLWYNSDPLWPMRHKGKGYWHLICSLFKYIPDNVFPLLIWFLKHTSFLFTLDFKHFIFLPILCVEKKKQWGATSVHISEPRIHVAMLISASRDHIHLSQQC